MTWNIVDGGPADADAIARGLHGALQSELPQSPINAQVVLTVRGPDCGLIGGVVAHTPYGWLHVRMLWVTDRQRNTGIATALMERAEAQGRTLGCHGAWLDTSNPLAKAFYERRGYAVFGELANGPGQAPETHWRWFMRKTFEGPTS